MKNANISTEQQPKGAARNPSDTLKDETAKPEPGRKTQSNADMSEVVSDVKRRD